jgi:ABC-type transport system involved in multi-copper enzyme maturation permease subunit
MRLPSGLGLGPVFVFEWLITSRRWQAYALRSGFVALLLVALWLAWTSSMESMRYRSQTRVMAELGQSLFYTFAAVQLAIVMVTAPGATAGAVCLDKARGTLLHLLVTDLTDREIIWGKLGSRLVPMIGLVFCGLPVMALMTLLGGIDPTALTGAFLISLGMAVLGCSLALLLSVWAGKAHEVVMLVYLIWVGWLLALPIGFWIDWSVLPYFGLGGRWLTMNGWFAKANPIWITFGPTAGGRMPLPTFADQVVFAFATLAASVPLLLLATWTVRRAATRSDAKTRRERAPRRGLIRTITDLLPAPGLDLNPVLWREWTRNRPSRWSLVIWWTYGLGAAFFSGLVIYQRFRYGPGWGRDLPAVVNVIQIGVGLLLLSVSASTSLVEERVRGSLDVLMTTPMSTLAILTGKWLGTARQVYMLAILPSLVAAACALETGQWYGAIVLFVSILAQGATITSLGLLIATRTPRLGRAIAMTVASYVLVAIGWMFCVALLLARHRGPDGFPRFLMGLSPLFNAGVLTESVNSRGATTWSFESQAFATFWTLAYMGVAAVLFLVTLAVFDRRMGRITGATEPRYVPLSTKSDNLVPVELVEV